ncbi:MAG: thioredoxin family protein [Candidatus Hydrothermales bacterium]
MGILREEDRIEVKKYFNKNLRDKVKLLVFSQRINCRFCHETEELLKELAELSDGKMELSIKNFAIEKEEAQKYSVDKVPAIVVLDKDGVDRGIRFFGIPAGYEFASLLEAITMVSKGESGLSEDVKEKLRAIDKEVHLQVFVTPSCPYCPQMVVLSHKFAYESEKIRGDMIEVTEFPELGELYEVMGVPKTIINNKTFIEGAVSLREYLRRIFEVLKSQ